MKKVLFFVMGLWMSASLAAQTINIGDNAVVSQTEVQTLSKIIEVPQQVTINIALIEQGDNLCMYVDEDLHIYDFYLSKKMSRQMYIEHLVIGLLRIYQMENNLPVNWWMIEKQAQQITRNFLN